MRGGLLPRRRPTPKRSSLRRGKTKTINFGASGLKPEKNQFFLEKMRKGKFPKYYMLKT